MSIGTIFKGTKLARFIIDFYEDKNEHSTDTAVFKNISTLSEYVFVKMEEYGGDITLNYEDGELEKLLLIVAMANINSYRYLQGQETCRFTSHVIDGYNNDKF